MLDPTDTGLESVASMDEISSDSNSSNTNETKKTCADCGTSKTPLWRGGPAGPKSLCNACGIRSRKKRRAVLNGGAEEKKSRRGSSQAHISSRYGGSSNQSNGVKDKSRTQNKQQLGDSLKHKLFALGREVLTQTSSKSSMVEKRRKLGEEEQAAVLLMALSCGYVRA